LPSHSTDVRGPSRRFLRMTLAALAMVLLSAPSALAPASSDCLAAQGQPDQGTGAKSAPVHKNSDCLDCHGEASFTTERDGETVSLYVDEGPFARSVHGKLACVTCHADLAKSELPHAVPVAPVKCGACHAGMKAKFAESLHGKALARGDPLAPRCWSCHGHHDILPVKDRNSSVSPLRVPFVCGSCHSEGTSVQRQRQIHQDHILTNYSESIHGEGLFKKGLSVSATCVSCHSSHQILPHTDPRSTIARENVVATCEKCHSQIEQVHRKVIRGELWQKKPESIPVCIDCHQPHKARKVFYEQGVADMDCLLCHGKPDVKASADGRSLFVNAEELKGSMHAGVACARCHTEVTPSLTRACETIKNKVDCAVCHGAQVEQYQESKHGTLHHEGNPDAPVCADCHGRHGVLGKKDVKSPTFPTNVPNLCATCHGETGKAAMRHHSTELQISTNYVESIHGKGLLKGGLVVTAMCTSCHTAHHELPASDPRSSVNRANVAATCAQCHKGVYEQYIGSIHSVQNRDVVDKHVPADKLPVCNNCHSAHKIKRTDQDRFRFEIMDICGKCHLSIAQTYFDTFHGKVSELGYAKTAKCHDCHGAHDILPVTDPNSHLNRQNIVGTCQKCHPGVTRRFAGYLTHATHHDPAKYPWIFWTFWSMTILLVGTFIISGVHTLMWLPRSLQMRREHPPAPVDPNEQQYVRFTLLNRCLHATMVVSFLTLATTGMTMKFSYTKWAVLVSRLLGGTEVTGFFHRFAAVLLMGIFCVHIGDLLRRKKSEFGTWKAMLFGPDTMLPTMKDLKEVGQTLKWYFGMGERPRYGRWTYWEKFDYFAVFWGIAIIGSSGLMLWFGGFFTRFLPGWLINVATIIHSDEALLAAGFIFTIHFFNTHFRPEKFPMDTVVFTGRMPLEDFKRERPAEYEELVASGELKRHLAYPLSSNIMRTIRTLAWIALGIGLSLVVCIIYAMLFAYR
jgi:cytochrome b subunit of formate dehydrogenase/5-methylcytosine-specific restriction endonuclease McrA